MGLISPYGRYVRGEVIARAKQIQKRDRLPWRDALARSYQEARAEHHALIEWQKIGTEGRHGI